jgi:hypothetical protein
VVGPLAEDNGYAAGAPLDWSVAYVVVRSRQCASIHMDRMTHPIAARLGLVILAMIGLWLCSCESTSDDYRIMRVDPGNLKVSFSDLIWFGELREIQGDYYESRIDGDRRTIAHFERLGNSLPVMLDSMMIDADERLIYRDKRQVLIRLADVAILAKTLYGYADPYRQAPPDVLVNAETDLGWERPQEEQMLTVSPPPKITGAALVRFLKQADGSVAIGSANYGLDGRMKALDTRSLHSGQIDNSTVAFQVNGQTFGNGTSMVDEPAKRDAFGFPEQFRISEYLREPRWPAILSAIPSVTDVVIIEYNINEWMRLDQYASSKMVLTRILHFKELPEDRMLAPIDHHSWRDSLH